MCIFQHGMTALIWASGRGHTEVVNHLLDAGANPDAADKVHQGFSAEILEGRLGLFDCVLGK